MPVIHETIPQFFNGVSQQAPNLRRVSQLEVQENCVSSITEGVIPRPPVEHTAQISASTLGNVFVHTINRSVTERFIVIIKNGSIEVYDFLGNAQTVTYPAGTGYLTSSDPKGDFEAYTVKDYTFIVNKTVNTGSKPKPSTSLPTGLSEGTDYYISVVDGDTIQLHTTASDAANGTNPVAFSDAGSGIFTLVNQPDSAITNKLVASTSHVDSFNDEIQLNNVSGINQADGPFSITASGAQLPGGLSTSQEYWLRVNSGTEVSFFTSKADAVNNTNKVDITSSPSSSGMEVVYQGDDTVFNDETITAVDFVGDDLTIPTHDYFDAAGPVRLSLGSTSVDGTVQQFSDLKDVYDADPAGNIYKIEGDETNNYASHYLEKTVNNGSDGDVYTEIADPALSSNEFDETTMPHQLVRTGATTFELQTIPWVARAAGDDTTNPFPSFTGTNISDLFVYRDRFGFLSGDNVIMSEQGADNFFNFFRTTVTQLLDSDRIDVSANNTRVADLQFAVPFTDSLLLFSEQTQFELGSDDYLTPTTVEIQPTTEFVTSTKARPVLAGRNVYFAVERTEYTGIREYFVDIDNRGNDAADVTKHVPRYIPKDVYKIVPSSNEDYLFCLSEQETNAVYVYQWYWAQAEGGLNKLQSAWHKWTLGTGANILNIDLIDNALYVVVERDGKTFLETIDLTTRKLDTGLLFQARLDRRTELTGVYDAGTGKTTWTLPYATSDDIVVVRGGGFTTNAGLPVLNTEQPTTTTVTADGDHSEDSCILGVEYQKVMTLSPFYIRSSSRGGNSIARLGGRLQLRKLLLFYSDSAFFSVEVTPKARSARTRNFSPAIGSNESVIGSVVPQDGVFSVPIVSKADTTTISIKSNSYLPFAITSAEWEGFYHSNAR